MAECKHTQWYLGGEFVWCSKCGAIHRAIEVIPGEKEATLVGEWVLPHKGLTQREFQVKVQLDQLPDMGTIVPMSKLLN